MTYSQLLAKVWHKQIHCRSAFCEITKIPVPHALGTTSASNKIHNVEQDQLQSNLWSQLQNQSIQTRNCISTKYDHQTRIKDQAWTKTTFSLKDANWEKKLCSRQQAGCPHAYSAHAWKKSAVCSISNPKIIMEDKLTIPIIVWIWFSSNLQNTN